MSDKQKKFRALVVKEIYETEKDYTGALEFTVTYILEKAKEKGTYDNSFTVEKIKMLFCNMGDILDFHKMLILDLRSCVGNKGPSYDTLIAQCYLRHKMSFELYRFYGENNEQAQHLLYELEENEAMKAFFIACMLLGGKGDDDISSYIFKPIQRICKYPLLFRELLKYTPTSHPDYEATVEAMSMMRGVCSVINEAKRRMEKLEIIADWQATVEGWEGSNITDTCNELIMEGPLVKISAGNTQDRHFFLFDNLFVYCKKSAMLGARKGLLFRGRIPVENLVIENIEDGTADYHTGGVIVSNSWKVQNVAKNKWIVLVARTWEMKQSWFNAIRKVKEKRKREVAGRASNTRNVILGKGEKIYHQVAADRLPKDHKVRLRNYPNSFSGEDFVKWLLTRKEVKRVEEAVILGQALVENGVIHHVSDRHQFKNNGYIYCFRYDDNTFKGKVETADLTARGIRVYCRLHGLFDPLIRDHRVGIRAMPCVVASHKLIDWWHLEKDIMRRSDGITLGEQLFATGVLRHVTDEMNFKDGLVLYRFTSDDNHEKGREHQKKPSASTFANISTKTCKTITLPYDCESLSYGVTLTNSFPLQVTELTPRVQTYGLSIGDVVCAINGKYITSGNPREYLGDLTPNKCKFVPTPLHLSVEKLASHHVSLIPTKNGLGFHVKGSSPVVISNVDIGSVAGQASMTVSSCVLKVGETSTLTMKHDEVVKMIKCSLEESGSEKSVSLKLSLAFVEHHAMFHYEGAQGEAMSMCERITESPYLFDIPAQLMQLYAHELTQMTFMLKRARISDPKVSEYLEDIQKVIGLYRKTHSSLTQPRWPSYKVHGVPQSKFLEVCPTNLHTTIMSVWVNDDARPSSLTSSLLDKPVVEAEDDGVSVPTVQTSYCISTMQIPLVESYSISKRDIQCLQDVDTRRKMLYNFVDRVKEMLTDYESIRKMIQPLYNGNHTLPVIPEPTEGDLTPVGSPSNSPTTVRRRGRLESVSNPEPIIKMVAQELVRKGAAMQLYLTDKLLLTILEDTKGIVEPTYQNVLRRLNDRLEVLSRDLKEAIKRMGEALVSAAKIFVEAVQRHMEELCVHLWVSLILCDKSNLMLSVDKLFSQVLTSAITAFVQQLSLAVRGQLNPDVEYGDSNTNNSKQWLQMISKNGVLVYYEATMLPMVDAEGSALLDFSSVLHQLERVVIIIQQSTDTSPPLLRWSELPPVTLEGDRHNLRVVLHLTPAMFATLPYEILTCTSGIKIRTVLFNKGLADLSEEHPGYALEKNLNMENLKSLECYYKQIRTFRLDKSNLPSDSDEKTITINKISIPLNAMRSLFIQLKNSVLEPTRPGVGLLTLAAELTTHMGALRVNLCDSGVYRSGLTSSLEQVMVLARCHSLPFKNFRTALNILRAHGQCEELSRKNKGDINASIPQEPPKLYRFPTPVPQEYSTSSGIFNMLTPF